MDMKITDVGEMKTLRDRIAESIRTSIIDGRIKPGERLTEPEVARQLGVSRTPLREAFFLLTSEGFVEAEPRRGVVVSDLSEKDAEETYILKGTLEGLGARLAAAHVTSDLIGKLKSLNERIADTMEHASPDLGSILAYNNEFHQILTDASGNRKLARMVSMLRRQTLRYNYIYLSVGSRTRRSIEEHNVMIDALLKKDAAGLEHLVHEHNEAALSALRAYMKHT